MSVTDYHSSIFIHLHLSDYSFSFVMMIMVKGPVAIIYVMRVGGWNEGYEHK